ncbi:hypothetical protein D3C78_1086310 [compost metagenome]
MDPVVIVVGDVVQHLGDELHRHLLRSGFGCGLGGFVGSDGLAVVGHRFHRGLGCHGAEDFGVDELVAGRNERLGGLLLAEAVDGQPFLAQARGQAGEVAVAGDQAEAVETAGVEQVHGVDDQRAVGGVLAAGVGELLHRLDRVVQQHLLPLAEVRLGPVAVDALDAGDAVLGDFLEEAFDDGRWCVVGVDQHGEVLLLP